MCQTPTYACMLMLTLYMHTVVGWGVVCQNGVSNCSLYTCTLSIHMIISEAIFIAAAQLYKNDYLLRIKIVELCIYFMRKKKNTRDCFVYFQSDFSVAIPTAGRKKISQLLA